MYANHIGENEIDLRSRSTIDSSRVRSRLFAPFSFFLSYFPFSSMYIRRRAISVGAFQFPPRAASTTRHDTTTTTSAFSCPGRARARATAAAVILQCLDGAPGSKGATVICRFRTSYVDDPGEIFRPHDIFIKLTVHPPRFLSPSSSSYPRRRHPSSVMIARSRQDFCPQVEA